jgi:hypothetical protein
MARERPVASVRLAGNPVLSNDQAFWKIVYQGRHMMPPLKSTVTGQQIADIRVP